MKPSRTPAIWAARRPGHRPCDLDTSRVPAPRTAAVVTSIRQSTEPKSTDAKVASCRGRRRRAGRDGARDHAQVHLDDPCRRWRCPRNLHGDQPKVRIRRRRLTPPPAAALGFPSSLARRRGCGHFARVRADSAADFDVHACAWVSARDAGRGDLNVSPARCARARTVELGGHRSFFVVFLAGIQNVRNVVQWGWRARYPASWTSIRARLGRVNPRASPAHPLHRWARPPGSGPALRIGRPEKCNTIRRRAE